MANVGGWYDLSAMETPDNARNAGIVSLSRLTSSPVPTLQALNNNDLLVSLVLATLLSLKKIRAPAGTRENNEKAKRSEGKR